MQFFSIKRVAITVGMAAALAVGTGIIPNATNHTSTAQAAELSQHGGNRGGHNGGGHNGGGHNGGGHNGGGHNGGGHMGNGHGGGHNGGGHGSFHGRNYRSSHGFSHTYWGYGFHNYYPQYYVTYAYEPVSICETYYFDEGSWYCFAGY
jgi:hypothetical protein